MIAKFNLLGPSKSENIPVRSDGQEPFAVHRVRHPCHCTTAAPPEMARPTLTYLEPAKLLDSLLDGLELFDHRVHGVLLEIHLLGERKHF